MKSVLQTLKEMVIKAIEQSFTDVLIYAEKVPQSGSKNCFGVTIKEVEQKPLLTGRREQWITICVEYQNFLEKRTKMESTEKAEQLYDVLALVGQKENQFFAGKMCHTMTEKGFCFEAIYYVQLHPVMTDSKMQRLEYNDQKLVGYGKI